jgi:hypothetical protein
MAKTKSGQINSERYVGEENPAAPPPKQSADDASVQRQSRIAAAAYFIAGQRGFGPGKEMVDWLAAEVLMNEAST